MLFVFLFSQQEWCVWFKLSPFVDQVFCFLSKCVSTNVCFANCVLLQQLVCQMLLHLFVLKFILVDYFHFIFLGTMVVVQVKEIKLVVALDDLSFGIRDLAFEAKVFKRYATFDQIINRSMENPGYAYLHYDLLNNAILTIITLKVKSLHKKMYE